MNWKHMLLITVITTALGYWVGATHGSKTETKIEEVEVIKRDVVTVVKEIIKPDGTTERQTTTVDRSKENREQSTAKTEIKLAPQYRVGVTAHTSNFRELESYTISAERRLFGPAFVGLSYNTKNVYGVSLSWEF
jgi:hypothetical protein